MKAYDYLSREIGGAQCLKNSYLCATDSIIKYEKKRTELRSVYFCVPGGVYARKIRAQKS